MMKKIIVLAILSVVCRMDKVYGMNLVAGEKTYNIEKVLKSELDLTVDEITAVWAELNANSYAMIRSNKTSAALCAFIYLYDKYDKNSFNKHYPDCASFKRLDDINFQWYGGSTLLHGSASCGNVQLVSKLVDAGADVSIKDDQGCTPFAYDCTIVNDILALSKAIAENNVKDMKPIVSCYYNNYSDTLSNSAAFCYACFRVLDEGVCPRRFSTEKELEELNNVDYRGFKGNTLLHLVAKSRDITILQKLFAVGADATLKNDDGNTPLIVAAMHGRGLSVKELVKKDGVEVNVVNNKGNTALYEAVDAWGKSEDSNVSAQGLCRVVQPLFDKGADLSVKNNDGKTALDLVQTDDVKEVLKKMQNIVAVNALFFNKRVLLAVCFICGVWGYVLNMYSKTKLHRAARDGKVDEVRRLLSQGADKNAKDYDGKTALQLAANNGHVEIVKLLNIAS